MHQQRLPGTLFRGGTSKGVFFRESDMPADREAWDDLLLELYGSPDPMQIDGVGGTHSSTSKAVIVSPATADGIDVEYRFGQVGIEQPVVDWGGNCGNLTFAVGPFALERGLVEADPRDGRTEVVLRNTNTATVIEQTIPVRDGRPRYDGDFTVHGVPGTGGRIRSRFCDPGGSVTGEVFPTGNRIDALDVDGLGPVEMSLVDVTSPAVFVRATDLGMSASLLPGEINACVDRLDRLERARSAACAALGFVDDPADASQVSPAIPKIAIVGQRDAYETADGTVIHPDEYDLLARVISMEKAHHAYAVTSAMCTAVAAALPDTIPNEFLEADRPDTVVLGHPKGTLEIGVGLDGEAVTHTEVSRTARQLMDGDLFYRPDRIR